MSIRHGVYIQEEATAVQVPKTGNSSVQVVVGTAPVNMAENPSEAVNVPILANSGTEAMAALGYSVDFKNFTLCQTMFATSNLFQVSPVVYINVLDPAKHNKELAEAEYQVNQKQAVIEKEGIRSFIQRYVLHRKHHRAAAPDTQRIYAVHGSKDRSNRILSDQSRGTRQSQDNHTRQGSQRKEDGIRGRA